MIMEHVKKTYNGQHGQIKVFEDVNLKVKIGECIVITGPTGCGKTTLLNLIAGFDYPDSGSIRVNGVDIVKLDADTIAAFRAKNMGIVFQSNTLIPELTVYENLELPLVLLGVKKEDRKKRISEIVEKAFIKGYVERKVSTLSAGEKQIIAIARALVSDPPIILMDEPLETLDPLTSDAILAFLKGEILERKTVIITTHKKRIAEIAGKIVPLRKKLSI
ncbi:ABC transporter ATP-binding protein [Candidatus Bathyarchaeota archaeon]|nr:MAG: ABC transporter ATP-binding protein [Candidatus Bathyarchaeota archaeon]